MKLNWGNALLIFFIVYVGVLVFVVFKSRTVDHSLVVDNYYDHDINFQKKLDKINNRQLLEKDLDISFENKEQLIRLNFGKQGVKSANVQLYRPDNKGSDQEEQFQVNESGIVDINAEDLISGRWTIKVEWKDGKREYYKEHSLYVSHP